jgi:hypothetical protein
MLSGITLYGMGAAAALHGLYCRAVLSMRTPTWALAVFVGSAVAFVIPAHIAIAVLGAVGLAAVLAARVAQSLASTRRLPRVATIWSRSLVATVVFAVATVAWGVLTGHSLGTADTTPSGLPPFSSGWRETVTLLALGGGVFLTIPVAWWRSRRRRGPARDLYVGVMALLIAGAIAWGWRDGEFTMFYLLFAGIAVYATAVVAIAVWALNDELRRSGRRLVALTFLGLCVIQFEIGLQTVTLRLQILGVAEYEPVATRLLGSIAGLPPNAKLAYSCGPIDEVAFGVPKLVTIDAVTARRVVPMCFEPEYPNLLLGAEPDMTVPSQFFRGAPQMALYPTSTATPSLAAVRAFLDQHDIRYLYVDSRHPNTLVPDAVLVASSGDVQVLKVP